MTLRFLLKTGQDAQINSLQPIYYSFVIPRRLSRGWKYPTKSDGRACPIRAVLSYIRRLLGAYVFLLANMEVF